MKKDMYYVIYLGYTMLKTDIVSEDEMAEHVKDNTYLDISGYIIENQCIIDNSSAEKIIAEFAVDAKKLKDKNRVPVYVLAIRVSCEEDCIPQRDLSYYTFI